MEVDEDGVFVDETRAAIRLEDSDDAFSDEEDVVSDDDERPVPLLEFLAGSRRMTRQTRRMMAANKVFGQEVLLMRLMNYVVLPEFARLQMTCRTAVVPNVDAKRYSRVKLTPKAASLLVPLLVWEPLVARKKGGVDLWSCR